MLRRRQPGWRPRSASAGGSLAPRRATSISLRRLPAGKQVIDVPPAAEVARAAVGPLVFGRVAVRRRVALAARDGAFVVTAVEPAPLARVGRHPGVSVDFEDNADVGKTVLFRFRL